MKKKVILTVLTTLVLGRMAFAQTERDFKVTVTEDGEGAIITGYTGTATAVRIPATIQGMPVREIGSKAFFNKLNLTSVVIPAGVTKIGEFAFSLDEANFGKSKLTSVTIPEGVTEIGNVAFFAIPLAAVTLPKSLTTIGYEAFASTSISSVTLPGTLTRYIIRDDGVCMVFWQCMKLKTVVISEGVTEIPAKMFFNCHELTTVTIPDSVTTLRFGEYPFYLCSKLSLASQAALRKRGYTGNF